MAMSTNNFLFNFNIINEDIPKKTYASPSRRALAGIIDCFIVLVLRACFLNFLNNKYFLKLINNFINDFEKTFGTRTPKGTAEHIEFIMSHSIFIYALIIIFMTISIGAIYHAYFNSSNWLASIGKRIVGIQVVNNNHEKISFNTGIFHYFLTIIPILFFMYVFVYSHKNNYELFETFSKNKILMILGLLLLISSHGNAFSKKKINLFDYLAKIEFHIGRTKNKMPWSKN